MSRLYSYKVRIYPTNRQIALIEENFSDARFVFNHMLDRNIKAYQRRKEYLSAFDMNYLLKSMKQYLPWLKKAGSTALTSACADLEDAYQNFFHKKTDFPRFKSKKHGKQSHRSTSPALKVDDKHVILPKIGPVRYRDGRNIPTDRKIQSITISRDTSDCYYASVLMKVDDIPHTKAANESIGLDLGIKEFLIDSTGNKIENP